LLNFALIGIYIIFIFLISKIFKKFYPDNQELLRKIIHIGMGPLIPIAKFLEIEQNAAQYFAGGISILIIINYIYKLFPIIEDIDRKSFGTFFYCLSLLIMISLFWEIDPLALTAGFFIMSFGDGLAGLIGKNFKSKSWKILNQKKSILGTATMFVISFLILSFLGFQNNIDFNLNYFYIALIATILEQISIIGIDNFTVPIITSTLFHLILPS
tara:strand:+ start:191 stop:832 length:642 start_codon:yes stop_codon:yes gene_type:complete